ncbi:hypothetical protein ACCO45_010708 [Purpureocillium lilacinum]|uniref:Uncharacterized protein n=1 Tax=Purpureocillium lilacinum TaxID=33203 RepID=A0ACC4DIL8_PURLI
MPLELRKYHASPNGRSTLLESKRPKWKPEAAVRVHSIHQRQDANAMSTGGIRALTRLILGMSCGHRWHRQLFPSLPALATDSYAKSYASSTNSSDAAPLPFSRFSFYSSRSSGWNNIAVAEKKGLRCAPAGFRLDKASTSASRLLAGQQVNTAISGQLNTVKNIVRH